MATTTKKPVKKTTTDLELMHKTVSNLTDIVTVLQHEAVQLKTDVQRIKIRMGI